MKLSSGPAGNSNALLGPPRGALQDSVKVWILVGKMVMWEKMRRELGVAARATRRPDGSLPAWEGTGPLTGRERPDDLGVSSERRAVFLEMDLP